MNHLSCLRRSARAGTACAACVLGALLAWPVWADDAAQVDCLFPSQVRRLGASTVTMTPRHQARVSIAECRKRGGEYIETVSASPPAAAASSASAGNTPIAPAPTAQAGGDPLSDLKIWLPMAAAGVVEAQVTAGQLYELMGSFALAKVWYDKAILQNSASAMVNLASLYELGRGVPRDSAQAQALILRASGLPPLAVAGPDKPRVQLIDPTATLALPRPAPGEAIAVDAPDGQLTVTGRAEASMGIAAVTVNGETRPHDAEGLFTAPLLLADVPVTLKIGVLDKAGVSGNAEYVFRRGVPASTPSHAEAIDSLSGRRWALVIANQKYQRWDALDTPVADGQALADTLRKRFGFDVTTLVNATRQNMLAALSQLRMKAGPDDQVIVYYAGHGQMDPVTARGYWIPVDADTRDLSNWVSVIDVTDQLSAMQARHVLVIADSCYSGTLAGSLVARIDAALSAEQRRQHLSQLSARRARVAFTSGGLEPVIDGGGGAHSLFARSLLDVLTQVQGPIGAQELSSTVSARFSAQGRLLKVQQQPKYAPIAYAGHEAGDFVLSPTASSR